MRIEESDLEEIAKKMPAWVIERLEPYDGGIYGGYFRNYPTGNFSYAETNDYKVLVAKWKRYGRAVFNETTAGEVWLEISFAKKDQKLDADRVLGAIIPTKHITTGKTYSASRNKTDLWPFNSAGIEVLKGNEVLVYWKDSEGKKGPSYKLNLDKEIKTMEKGVK